jgi:hypothetical protein
MKNLTSEFSGSGNGSRSPTSRSSSMHDLQIFSKLLRVAPPWEIERVDLRLRVGEGHVFLRRSRGVNGRVRGVSANAGSTIINSEGQ